MTLVRVGATCFSRRTGNLLALPVETHFSGFLLTKLIPDGFNRLVDERPPPLHFHSLEPLDLDDPGNHASVEEIAAHNLKEI